MRVEISTRDIPTAGVRVRLNNTISQITFVQVQARPANTGNIFFGLSDVASTVGWVLIPGQPVTIDFDPDGKGTSIVADTLWLDTATNGNDADYIMVFK